MHHSLAKELVGPVPPERKIFAKRSNLRRVERLPSRCLKAFWFAPISRYMTTVRKITTKRTIRFARRISSLAAVALASAVQLCGQIAITGIASSDTQAAVTYISPVAQACSVRVADINRGIAIAYGTQAAGQVTVHTVAPHGLLAGAVVYLESSGAWSGWQSITSVPAPDSFTFLSAQPGGLKGGSVGVLVDDINPALFSGADQDSRDGNVIAGQSPGGVRTFVVGKRTAEVGSDGNRYSRALQAYSRHHLTLTCGTQALDREFSTANIPAGDTHNEGIPADRNHPGEYGYPSVQWGNARQAMIDPLTGVLSHRATGPFPVTPIAAGLFATALDLQGAAWKSPSAPLTNTGAFATFTGPCSLGVGGCALFLRADNLSFWNAATYGYTQADSFDWFQAAINAAISNASCSGADCNLRTCMVVNGVSCASPSKALPLTTTPTTHIVGSQNPMDLWQCTASPCTRPPFSSVDATRVSGAVNYDASTKRVTLVSGSAFNLHWTSGSRIVIAGAEFTIASLQNEALLTLASGPPSSLTGTPYSANNFGILIWKETQSADTVSIGFSTYAVGSSTPAGWPSGPMVSCSTAIVAVNGVAGNNCFIGDDLFWLSSDGTTSQDLGYIGMSYDNGAWGDGMFCGQQYLATTLPFDPSNGDIWYCTQVNRGAPGSPFVIVKMQYVGSHTTYAPSSPTGFHGNQLPECVNGGNVQPCIVVTNMQPNAQDALGGSTMESFNPALNANGYTSSNFMFVGIDELGNVLVQSLYENQDSPGWLYVYSLGDRTPMGHDANSMRLVAAASTYLVPSMSWCVLHHASPPMYGWIEMNGNNLGYDSPGEYLVGMTSAPLNANIGTAGGLMACPGNPFGVAGIACTAVTVGGPPLSTNTGATFPPWRPSVVQTPQVGDVMYIDSEYLRIIALADSTNFVVQRGYLASGIANHGGSYLSMDCGAQNGQWATGGSKAAVWNFASDPYGANSSGATLGSDQAAPNSHYFASPGLLMSAGYTFHTGATYNQYQNSGAQTIAEFPTFAGLTGFTGGGNGNGIDSHPGPCIGITCFDAHPMDGLNGSNQGSILGSAAAPYANVTQQLWKITGANTSLNRKVLSTFAYSGRWPLVDVSGPASAIGGTSADSYKYCVALASGECRPGSAVGDVYVNSPFVSHPYCYYAGIAVPPDDVTSICIGDLSSPMAALVQFLAVQDSAGAYTRRLGSAFNRWNQQYVFLSMMAAPSLNLAGAYTKWMEGVRSEVVDMNLPPMPPPDSVVRNTFIPVPVAPSVPSGVGVASAEVEFGYNENGGEFYCTSRQETCVATTAAVNPSSPFYYEQTESFSPPPCASSCAIAIPALSQHVLYYRWRFLGAGGQVVATSQTQVVVIP